jgi:hypothetical protein
MAENKGPATLAIVCSVTAVSSLFVIARFFVRARILRKVYYDDYVIVFSMVSLRDNIHNHGTPITKNTPSSAAGQQ